MIKTPTTPKPTTSVHFDADAADGEVRLIGIINMPSTGIWILAETINPDPEIRDFYRMYPPNEFSAKIGLIATYGTTIDEAKQVADSWS